MGKDFEKVPISQTVERLCRAIASLKKREQALFEFLGSQDQGIDEIGDLEGVLLDLCGAPADNAADGNWEKSDIFCRDWLSEKLGELVTADLEDEDFDGIFLRVKALTREVLDDKTPEKSAGH